MNRLTPVHAEGPSLSQGQVSIHLHRPPCKTSSVFDVGHGVHLHSCPVLQCDQAGKIRILIIIDKQTVRLLEFEAVLAKAINGK